MIYLSHTHNREAKAILAQHLSVYRHKTYAELLELPDDSNSIYFELRGPSGHEYQIEIDARKNKGSPDSITVTGMIADGWISSYITVPPFIQSFTVEKETGSRTTEDWGRIFTFDNCINAERGMR